MYKAQDTPDRIHVLPFMRGLPGEKGAHVSYSFFRLFGRPLNWPEFSRLTEAGLSRARESSVFVFKVCLSLICLPTLHQDLGLAGRGLGILERLGITSWKIKYRPQKGVLAHT